MFNFMKLMAALPGFLNKKHKFTMFRTFIMSLFRLKTYCQRCLAQKQVLEFTNISELMERTAIYQKVMFIEIIIWWFRLLMAKNV